MGLDREEGGRRRGSIGCFALAGRGWEYEGLTCRGAVVRFGWWVCSSSSSVLGDLSYNPLPNNPRAQSLFTS